MRTGSGVRYAKSVVQGLRVTSILFDRRPAWAHWQRRRRKFCEFFGGINDLPTDDRKYRFEMLDFFLGNGEIVGRENSQVSQLARSKRAFFAGFRREPTAPHRVEFKCFLAIESVLFRIETEAPNGFACDKPIEGKVWVITRNECCVGACSHGNAHLQHAADRWSAFSLL